MKRIRPITELEKVQKGELETCRRLIEEVYPSGIVSIVSDTWDLWHVLTDTMPKLKTTVMERDGKVVIRPDSGDPVDIICGIDLDNVTIHKDVFEVDCFCSDYAYCEKTEKYYKVEGDDTGWTTKYDLQEVPDAVIKGVIQLLHETFGGTVNSKGFIQLDPHVGAIYGDAITVARCEEICRRLNAKGFASTNIVFGIGSFTYQYNTRDTFGFAMKATHCVIDGKEVNIFKDPATDTDKVKKSLTGRCVVLQDHSGKLTVMDGLTIQDQINLEYSDTDTDQLQYIFVDGKLLNECTLAEVRARIEAAI